MRNDGDLNGKFVGAVSTENSDRILSDKMSKYGVDPESYDALGLRFLREGNVLSVDAILANVQTDEIVKKCLESVSLEQFFKFFNFSEIVVQSNNNTDGEDLTEMDLHALRQIEPGRLEYERIKLTNEQVEEICNEIEHQWLYLVMVRAVFRADFPAKDRYESPGFYEKHGITFTINLPKVKSDNFIRASTGIKNWLNQNYVIRLYGILEKYGIMYSGRKAYANKLMKLMHELRPKIGAHTAGRRPDDRAHLRRATELINELFKKDREFDIDQVEHYALPLDAVLEPMKDQAIAFVRSLRA